MSTDSQIYFSYAWGDENEQGESREKIVNDLYNSLLKDHFKVIRDKNNIEYKGFISEFMGRIGAGKWIVVVISKKYLKSPYCMFELYEIARNSNFDKAIFRDKVFPIVIEFVDFADPKVIEAHLSYWEHEFKVWDDLLKKRSGQLSVEQMQRYDRIKMIYQNFGKLTEWIIDICAFNPQLLSADNFAEIKKAIIERGTKDGRNGRRPGNRLLKKPVFWVVSIAIIILIATSLKGIWKTNPPFSTANASSFIVVGPAGEQLLIVRDTNTRKFGYAWQKDTSQFISCKYEEANSFTDGIALVKMNGKYRWIKPDSSYAFDKAFDQAANFNGRRARVINGGDTFYINIQGERQALGQMESTKANKNELQNERQPKDKEKGGTGPIEPPPKVPMCDVTCDTKGIKGVEVSFVDSKTNKNYVKVSGGGDLQFNVPCYLLNVTVLVRFRRNDTSEPRNFILKDMEIPEMFRNK